VRKEVEFKCIIETEARHLTSIARFSSPVSFLGSLLVLDAFKLFVTLFALFSYDFASSGHYHRLLLE
jgi:hypothetical protein